MRMHIHTLMKNQKGDNMVTSTVKCSECGADIKSVKVVDYSLEHFGAAVCMVCQKKRVGEGKPAPKVAPSKEEVYVRQTSINAAGRIVAAMIASGAAIKPAAEVTRIAWEFEKWIGR